jgi:hypothetical protein
MTLHLSSLSPEQHTPDHPRGESQPANDGDPHKSLAIHLIINKCPEASCLQVAGFLVDKEIVVASSFSVVA